jgi:hypothetical protein
MKKAKSRIKRKRTSRGTYRVSYKENFLPVIGLTVSLVLLGLLQVALDKQVLNEVPDQVVIVQANNTEIEPTPAPKLDKCLNGTHSELLIKNIERKSRLWTKIKERFPKEPICAGELIARESSFNEFALNPTSGSCGLVQSLPCSKLTNVCALKDIDCQLDWLDDYVTRRYGSFEKALEFWDNKKETTGNGWY